MTSVWHGVPVTDEALTQCIRTLRRLLDDDAAAPRLSRPCRSMAIASSRRSQVRSIPLRRNAATKRPLRRSCSTSGAGALGGGFAGLIGGVIYGSLVTPVEPGSALSLLFVLTIATGLVGLVGGAGVSVGLSLATRIAGHRSAWLIVGGACGGLLIGAAVKLLGLDALAILLGRRPGDITGAGEGLLLGVAAGLAGWLAPRLRLRVGIGVAAASGAVAGVFVALIGGHLMAGSLHLLVQATPAAGFRLDGLAAQFGERSFGPVTALVTASLEGALFVAGVIGTIGLARRHE